MPLSTRKNLLATLFASVALHFNAPFQVPLVPMLPGRSTGLYAASDDNEKAAPVAEAAWVPTTLLSSHRPSMLAIRAVEASVWLVVPVLAKLAVVGAPVVTYRWPKLSPPTTPQRISEVCVPAVNFANSVEYAASPACWTPPTEIVFRLKFQTIG